MAKVMSPDTAVKWLRPLWIIGTFGNLLNLALAVDQRSAWPVIVLFGVLFVGSAQAWIASTKRYRERVDG